MRSTGIGRSVLAAMALGLSASTGLGAALTKVSQAQVQTASTGGKGRGAPSKARAFWYRAVRTSRWNSTNRDPQSPELIDAVMRRAKRGVRNRWNAARSWTNNPTHHRCANVNSLNPFHISQVSPE